MVLVLIANCGTFSLYDSAFNSIKNTVRGNKIIINETIKSIPYSMLLIDYLNSETIMILSEVNNGDEKWLDADGNGFYLNQGIILKTFGFKNNVEFLNPPKLKEILIGLKNAKSINLTSYVKLSNPPTNYLEFSRSFNIKENGTTVHPLSMRKIKHILIEEQFIVKSIGWKGKNYYWISEEDGLIRAKINIFPNQKIHIKKLKGY